jgi:transposase
MRTLQLVNHLTNAQLKERLAASKGKPEFSRWQILYMVQVTGIHSAELISPLVNLSRPSIYKIVQQYNKLGGQAIKYTPRGGRRRSLLSIEDEAELLITIEQRAAKGLVKTANDIRAIVEVKVGKVVSDDYLWDLLNRNGWKKKMPRPHHPKRSIEKQEEFKKNSPNVWLPSTGLQTKKDQ